MSDTQPTGASDAEREVVLRFAHELGRLRELNGNPSFERMSNAVRHANRAAGSKNTFHRMVNGPNRIYESEFVRGFVLALGLDDEEADAWERRRLEALQESQLARDEALIPQDPHRVPIAQPRMRYKRSFAAAIIIVIAAAVVAAITASAVRGKSAEPDNNYLQAAPRDGADPKDSGCSLDPAVKTLDSTEVHYGGMPVGLDELRYSPKCGAAWARFTPFPQARIPTGAIIHVDIVRPDSGNLKMPFQAHYAGAAVYGNLLRSTEDCVYAESAIDVGERGLPESHTACFRGETPVDSDAPRP